MIEEVSVQKYDKNAEAHAVFIDEFGNSKIDITNNDRARLIYNYLIDFYQAVVESDDNNVTLVKGN